MPDKQVTFRGTSEQLRRYFQRLPLVLAGREPDTLGIVRGLQLRLGVRLLSLVQQAFEVKSKGGKGDDGIIWPPLKPETIARRRQGKGDKRLVSDRTRTANLTAEQKKFFRQEVKRRTGRLIHSGLDRYRAAVAARGQVVRVLRKQGAAIQTKAGILGGRDAMILRDSGKLFNSLSPGVEDKPSSAPGQIFETPAGSVIVGTNVPYAAAHHNGTSRLPARPFWPKTLPAVWWRELLATFNRGLLRALGDAIARGRF